MDDQEYFEYIKKRDAEQAKRDEAFQEKMIADAKKSHEEHDRFMRRYLVFWIIFLVALSLPAFFRWLTE